MDASLLLSEENAMMLPPRCPSCNSISTNVSPIFCQREIRSNTDAIYFPFEEEDMETAPLFTEVPALITCFDLPEFPCQHCNVPALEAVINISPSGMYRMDSMPNASRVRI